MMMLFILVVIFFLDLDKDDIIANLTDIIKRDQILLFPAKKSADASGSRDDQTFDPSGTFVKLNVPHKSQPFSITDIHNFHTSQFTYSHNPIPVRSLLLYDMQILAKAYRVP